MIFNRNWEAKLSPPLITIQTLAAKTPEKPVVTRLILELAGIKTDRVAALVESNQGKVRREIGLIPSLVVELPTPTLTALAQSRYIKRIWYDAPVRVLLNTAVPTVGGEIPRESGITGKGVTVAVLDTGIYPHHDLITPKNRILAWHDLVNEKSAPYDDNGHGTHVAGIIAGNGESSRGKYRGLAPDALLVGVKVADEEGSGKTSTVIAGIEWCLNQANSLKVKVMNLSLGTMTQESCRTDPLCRAVSSAWHQGVVVCAAAGNAGPESRTIDSPGINPEIITVGNLDDQQTLNESDDRLSKSSSRGPTPDNFVKPDLLAPGTNVVSLWPGGGYKSLSGTSMATPMVAGAAALILENKPSLKPDQVKKLLMKNARDLGMGPNLQGAGALDLKKIFKSISKQSGGNFTLDRVGQIFACHIFQDLFSVSRKSLSLLEKKRNELLQESLVSLISGLGK